MNQPETHKYFTHYKHGHSTSTFLQSALTDLFGIKLVELHFLSVLSPQTQDLGLGAVGHVDQLLKPPAVMYHACDAPQQQTVVTHLCMTKTTVAHDSHTCLSLELFSCVAAICMNMHLHSRAGMVGDR